MMKWSRILVTSFTTAAVAVSAFGFYEVRRVTVESDNGHYQSRRVDTRGGVRLVRKLSDAPCIYGRSWGFDRDRVWVDDGCRAVFEVGNGRNDWDRDGDRYRDRDRDWDRNRDRDDRYADNCPDWLPGRYNAIESGVAISFEIERGGRVNYRHGRDRDDRGYYRDNCLYIGDRVYDVSRRDNGVWVRPKGGRDRWIELHRG